MAKTDQYTAKLTPNNISSVTNQYFDLDEPFAVPRYGNKCTSYISGRDYMKAVADAIRGATNFILIADWQLDYDVELDNRGDPKHLGRLSELLADALQRGVHVRVLCYDSVNLLAYLASLVGTSGPPDTHEGNTQKSLENLPKAKGSIKVMLQNPNTGKTWLVGAPNPNIAFSHHQKFVVVDGKITFLGGIDLAYGRWDTPAFNVVIDPKTHVLNDAYNAQIVPTRQATDAEMTLTKGQTNERPGFAPPHYTSGKKLLDPDTQPREPWNDVAVKIEGAAAFDVYVNFVLRWNSFAGLYTNTFDGALHVNWLKNVVKPVLVDPLAGYGLCNVQIVRSASSAQLANELKVWRFQEANLINDDHVRSDQKRRNIMMGARKSYAGNHQTSIMDAMINCIRAAQACIYIENQFFVSDCGHDIRGTAAPAKNQIVAELANAVGQAIYAERAFHVWIVLPEHAEGMLEQEATSAQAWWALQGIKHGNNSLINRINATLLAKNKKKWDVDKPMNNNADIAAILKIHGMENKWREYLTVLNLRNYGQTKKAVLTEMIYTHSKLLIVDDAVVILGSANINDRSLLGNNDTELAAVIVDNEEGQMTEMGQGIRCNTRKFARDLRIKLWKKHLGMLIDEATTGVQKEDAPPMGINLEQPLASSSINGLLGQAIVNRQAYNRVFTHTPRNEFGTLTEGRKQYPPLTKKVKKYEINGTPIGEYNSNGTRRDPYVLVDEATSQQDFSKLPPLQKNFMDDSLHNISAAMKELRGAVKGFVVEMPLDWGIKETATPLPPRKSPALIAQKNSDPEKQVHSS